MGCITASCIARHDLKKIGFLHCRLDICVSTCVGTRLFGHEHDNPSIYIFAPVLSLLFHLYAHLIEPYVIRTHGHGEINKMKFPKWVEIDCKNGTHCIPIVHGL